MNVLAFPPSYIERIGSERFRIKDIRGTEFETSLAGLATYLLAYGEKSDDLNSIYEKIRRVTDIKKERLEAILEKLTGEELLVRINYNPDDFFHVGRILENALTSFKGKEALSIAFVGISVGSECPYNCKGCYRPENLDTGRGVDDKKYEGVIDDASKLGAKSIAITGGEPTHPKLIERTKTIAEMAFARGLDVNLTTSGYALFEHIGELEKYLCGVQISLDGFREYHDVYRGMNGSFDRALQSITACTEREIPVMINCTVTNDNIDEVDNFSNYLKTNFSGVVVRFSPIIPKGKGKEYCHKNYSEFVKKCFNRIMETKRKNEGKSFTFSPKKRICFAGTSMAYIREDGLVFPCSFIDESIGSIEETSFYDIWQSPKLEKYRGKEIVNGDAEIMFNCRALADAISS